MASIVKEADLMPLCIMKALERSANKSGSLD